MQTKKLQPMLTRDFWDFKEAISITHKVNIKGRLALMFNSSKVFLHLEEYLQGEILVVCEEEI